VPKLIILRGNSGSGKTMAAKALQQRFGPNTMLISHDMVRMQILHVGGKEGIQKSLPLMSVLLRYGRQHSEITILEGILDSEEYRPLFEACVSEYGADIYAYYYDLPFEETLLRHATKPNRQDFGEEEMRRWWREKDFLTLIPETVLEKDLSLKEAVEKIIGEVTAGRSL
jgi:predicted kinase